MYAQTNIRSASSKSEAVEYFMFAKSGQKLSKYHPRNEKYYAKQFLLAPDLLLAVYFKNKLIGVLLGTLETDRILIGEFYIDPTFQKKGIGSRMLRAVEKRALEHNIHNIYLGADSNAELFYLKNNYVPEFFIQLTGNNKKEAMDCILKKYPEYPVIWRQDNKEGSKVILKTKILNNKLHKEIKFVFPKANTTYLFTKEL